MGELVLCVRTEIFLQALREGQIKDLMWFQGKTSWEVRDDRLENDDNFLQIIPYCVVEHPQTMETGSAGYLSYRRSKAGGEKRLTGKKSIGFGGHINPTDDNFNNEDPHSTIMSAALREVQEELGTEWDDWNTPEVKGLIWQPGTPVGRHHLGIYLWVDSWNLNSDPLINPGEEVTELEWLTAEKLDAIPDLEGWTRALLDGDYYLFKEDDVNS